MTAELTRSTDYADRSASVIRPIMTLSKFPNDASFLLTPTEGYWNLTESALNHEGFWEEKTDPRVFWRGSSTGGWDVLYRDWRDSHRIRMHKLVNGQKGDKQWKEDEVEVMLPDGKDGWISTSRKAGVLSKAYADVKLSGQAHQVSAVPLTSIWWMIRIVKTTDSCLTSSASPSCAPRLTEKSLSHPGWSLPNR
jgi:hypothetical protein